MSDGSLILPPMRFLPLLLLAACSPLSHVRYVAPVEIRAYSEAAADHVAQAVTPALATIETLPSTRHLERVCVLVHEGTEGRTNRGVSTSDRIELRLDPHLDAAGWRSLVFLLTHELSHHYLSDEWRTLPAVIDEGLADFMAMRAETSMATDRRLAHLVLLTDALSDPESFESFLARVDVSREELFHEESDERKALLTALGWYLVDRIGIDGLAALVEAARAESLKSVPWPWILARADFDPAHPEVWKVGGPLDFGP